MTYHQRDNPQFYLTAPASCPYIEGQVERKVFTHLVGERAAELNDVLSEGGFRRSQNIAYRPACEGCRAIYPYVKQIMAAYPDKVRLVLRYVLFHKGSEEAVRILETAREQGIYEPVLDAVMEAQPQWHDDPDVTAAWDAAESAGLDVEAARAGMNSPEIDGIIQQDAADVKAVRISGTPTFYVNGEKLNRLGPQELYDLVTSKVELSKYMI